MTKVQTISKNITPFAGVFYANDEFTRSGLRKLIETHLGHRISTRGSSCIIANGCSIGQIACVDICITTKSNWCWGSFVPIPTCPEELISSCADTFAKKAKTISVKTFHSQNNFLIMNYQKMTKRNTFFFGEILN